MDQSEALKFEQTKTLRLSEAIRIGARIMPQCIGDYFVDDGSCALGAAAEAMGRMAGASRPCYEFHFLTAEARDAYWKAYGTRISEDNDSGMSREDIADRLEKIGY